MKNKPTQILFDTVNDRQEQQSTFISIWPDLPGLRKGPQLFSLIE